MKKLQKRKFNIGFRNMKRTQSCSLLICFSFEWYNLLRGSVTLFKRKMKLVAKFEKETARQQNVDLNFKSIHIMMPHKFQEIHALHWHGTLKSQRIEIYLLSLH